MDTEWMIHVAASSVLLLDPMLPLTPLYWQVFFILFLSRNKNGVFFGDILFQSKSKR